MCASKHEEPKKKDGSDVFRGELNGLEQFGDYSKLFDDLTKRCFIDTKKLDVVSMIITYDSKFCIALLSNNQEREYSLCELHQYNLKSH